MNETVSVPQPNEPKKYLIKVFPKCSIYFRDVPVLAIIKIIKL